MPTPGMFLWVASHIDAREAERCRRSRRRAAVLASVFASFPRWIAGFREACSANAAAAETMIPPSGDALGQIGSEFIRAQRKSGISALFFWPFASLRLTRPIGFRV